MTTTAGLHYLPDRSQTCKTMKINLIPLGARFQWKGITYTKIGPMTASGETGGVAFIPKHAVLSPVPGEAPPPTAPDTPAQPLDAGKVMAAFESYHQTALTLTDDAGREALESARTRFLADAR